MVINIVPPSGKEAGIAKVKCRCATTATTNNVKNNYDMRSNGRLGNPKPSTTTLQQASDVAAIDAAADNATPA